MEIPEKRKTRRPLRNVRFRPSCKMNPKSSSSSVPSSSAPRRGNKMRRTVESCSEDSEDLSRNADSETRQHGLRGHDYRNITIQGAARTQLGDTYIEHQINYTGLEQATSERNNQKRIPLLEALAFQHMDTRLASVGAAHDQTCKWLFDTRKYTQWRGALHNRSRRRFLWIKGKPGAGKSTMMKIALEQAPQHFRHSIITSFFFNARGYGLAKTTEGMYRTLLHQIFTALPRLPVGIPTHVTQSIIQDGWPAPMLQDFLRKTVLSLGNEKSLVCYIDALDECEEDDVRCALGHLEELGNLSAERSIDFLVCLASRHYPNITIRHHHAMNLDDETSHWEDISQYVTSALQVRGSLGTELHQSINDRCGGVFLWAVLTVRILNKLSDGGGTRSQLRRALLQVPGEIHTLFADILYHRDKYLLPVLQWVLFAFRPLSISELYFAVKASTGDLSSGVWDSAEISVEGMQDFILASSKGLVDFSGRTAQLIHESLREHLLRDGLAGLDPRLKDDVTSISHDALARCCLAYAALCPVPHRDADFPFAEYAIERTIDHMTSAFIAGNLSDSVCRQFSQLWLASDIYQYSLWSFEICAELLCRSLAKQSKSYEPGLLEGKFLSLLRSNPDPRFMLNLGLRTLYRPYNPLPKIYPWLDANELSRDISPILQAAVDAGSLDMSSVFHDRRLNTNFSFLAKQALILAAGLGLDLVVGLLPGDTTSPQTRDLAHQALWAASMNLQVDTVKLLLHRGVDPNAVKLYTRHGIQRMLKVLAGASDPASFDGNADKARFKVAEALLHANANARNALAPACGLGRDSLVRLLVDLGAKVDHSAISEAQTGNHPEVLRILLEAQESNTAESTDSTDESCESGVSDASTTATRSVNPYAI